MNRIGRLWLTLCAGMMMLGQTASLAGQHVGAKPRVYFADASRLGRPFAKDPSVIKFKGRYWMYYSMPPWPGGIVLVAGFQSGWGIGIAQSKDLIHWKKVGELTSVQEIEQAGIAAPGARVIDGKVHVFYQTYGKGKLDAICHAVSSDGLHFEHDASNPVYRPTQMAWSAGRAIDGEVFQDGQDLLLFFATRDPEMKIQEIGLAKAAIGSDLGRGAWHDVSIDAPILKPELPWEKTAVEAPSVLRHNGMLYMFYAGAFDNAPQQIGLAVSKDGLSWRRMSDEPLLANGTPGSWDSSESGSPSVFTDDDGRMYLFYQGNNDNGITRYISMKEILWHGDQPYLVEPAAKAQAK